MKNSIKKLFNSSVIHHFKYKLKVKNQIRKYQSWHKNGRPIPPPHMVKQKMIKEYRNNFGHRTLIETGTFKGDMIMAQINEFDKIISIELGEKLFREAQQKFRNFEKVRIVHGDSGQVLPQILSELNEPVIFWLDGHYSQGQTAKGHKDCPIFEELNAIFNSKSFNHAILIDDARLFIGENDYPTIDELTKFVKQKNVNYSVDVEHDVIRFVI